MSKQQEDVVVTAVAGSEVLSDSKEELPLTSEKANAHPAQDRGFLAWFDKNDGPVERRLVLKLDFTILSFACMGFWVMYIDRGILANAYVSGMREDLKLLRNEYVQLQSVFTVGYAVSMIPSTLLVTKIPAHIVLPTSTFLWGLFTMLCFWAKGFGQLAAYRLIIGLCEGPFFCSIHYVLGSWYRPDEIVRRAGIFYMSSGVGTVSTGVLAARIYRNLDGSLGHAGWRWMFLIGSLCTFPIALWGATFFPGALRTSKRWFLTEEEHALALERMRLVGRKSPQGLPFSLSSVKRFFGRWHFWVLVPWNIIWILGMGWWQQHILWLRAQPQYDTFQVNNYTAISPSLGVVFIFTFSWVVDKWGDRAKIPLFGFVTFMTFIAALGFVLYDQSSFAWKWFAVAIGYMLVSLSPVIYSHANLVCAGDAEERAFIISSMLATGTAFNSWVPILAWPTVEAPRFHKGYILTITLQPIYFLFSVFVFIFSRRMMRKEKALKEAAEAQQPVA
ncbi:hypothetical protein Z517_02065 [Fonsecaea pedrosoi CBS 271.37]|uniref:Major facilitator superfamily (MFS) profile domain-containing protein n=1 Tax=Fonsecaea pedrosoi CBS 271.37 TaxID=1442368 RepID=A0A0D2F8A5_9EURO|nr:uncharacterized protein Z517_02065 [Fonsecaea pedrosoi CBS 271.37]KIW82822.1 hypothetical protein Z517_02065 [Fonsecaea pedrosoi CBS 271.37]